MQHTPVADRKLTTKPFLNHIVDVDFKGLDSDVIGNSKTLYLSRGSSLYLLLCVSTNVPSTPPKNTPVLHCCLSA